MATKKMSKPKKSKRIPTHKKMKMERKIRKNKKKIRKQIRKMTGEGKLTKREPNILKQQLRIPNLYPFKRNLIEQLSRKKNMEHLARKLKAKAKTLGEGQNKIMIDNALKLSQKSEFDQNLGVHAYNKDITYDNSTLPNNSKIQDENTAQVQNNDMMKDLEHYNSKSMRNPKTRNFNRLIKQIFETADILLEVLDARDPLGCRSFKLERDFVSRYPTKKLILVLNKIDLIPLEVCNKWKKILSNEFPTVLFKANLQNQRKNLATGKVFSKSFETRKELVKEISQSSKAVGADKLIELLKNYSRCDGTNYKTAITVGIIGMPNVGKSSIINSLLRRKAAGVSSIPGHTKTLKEVELDSKVTILDAPGIIITNEDETSLLLRNVIKTEDVADLQKAVQVILTRIEKDFLLRFYKIADFYNYKEFLVNVGKAKGKFKKGGVIDLNLAARMVVQDWNAGRLNYYTHPPEIKQVLGPARVVSVVESKQNKLEIE